MRLTLPKNTKGRDFILGDLHGCLTAFNNALAMVQFDENKDRIIAAGDLIDRGENSLKCLELIRQPWFHTVLGNHEQFMIDCMEGWGCTDWISNGGAWSTLPGIRDILMMMLDEVKALPLQIDFEWKDKKIGVVHAEPPQCWDDDIINAKLERVRMLWSRNRVKDSDPKRPMKNIDHVFCGHTPMNEVTTKHGVTYVDTGAVFGYSMTLVDVNDHLSNIFID